MCVCVFFNINIMMFCAGMLLRWFKALLCFSLPLWGSFRSLMTGNQRERGTGTRKMSGPTGDTFHRGFNRTPSVKPLASVPIAQRAWRMGTHTVCFFLARNVRYDSPPCSQPRGSGRSLPSGPWKNAGGRQEFQNKGML